MRPDQRDKYSRQILFEGVGEQGQDRLLASSAVLVGCGALGTFTSNLLVRAGVGRLKIVDRDFVEPSNLQRQTLFEEADAREALPKAVAAERRLRAANADAEIEAVVADVTPRNAVDLLSGFPIILDGTDNFETRLLINDLAISLAVPWIYAAVVGSYGVTMAILPGETACLACLMETGNLPSAPGAEPTCDTAGVLNAAVGVVASVASAEAMKLLAGRGAALTGRLFACDVWSGRAQSVRVSRHADCRACVRRDFRYLTGAEQPRITLCGRDSVQIHERRRALDLEDLSKRLKAAGSQVRHNGFLLRFRIAPYEMTVFSDGRAIIKGTQDPAIARALYSRFIGS